VLTLTNFGMEVVSCTYITRHKTSACDQHHSYQNKHIFQPQYAFLSHPHTHLTQRQVYCYKANTITYIFHYQKLYSPAFHQTFTTDRMFWMTTIIHIQSDTKKRKLLKNPKKFKKSKKKNLLTEIEPLQLAF